MRTEQTEKRLAAELAAETPDVLANILLCCTPEAQRRVMNGRDARHDWRNIICKKEETTPRSRS